jgi:hypothetical protein
MPWMAWALSLALSACGGASNPAARVPAEPVMTVVAPEQLPQQIATGTDYSVSLHVNNPRSEPITLALDWGDGAVPERREIPSNGNAQWSEPQLITLTKSYNNTSSSSQTYEWMAQLLGSAQETLLQVSGSVTVTPGPQAPVLQLGNTTVTTIQIDQIYKLVFKADDHDGDLSAVFLSWSDENEPRSVDVNGSTAEASFDRIFTLPGTRTWTAVVHDSSGRSSEKLSGQINVTAPIPTPSAPSLSLNSTPLSHVFTQTAYELSFNAEDKDSDLQTVTLRWSDELSDRSVAVSGSTATAVKFPRTFSEAGTFTWTAKAQDTGGRASVPSITGQVVVSEPPPADDFPLPIPQTNAPLLAPQECPRAQNNFFNMPAADANVEKRRRYVAEQFLVVKPDKTGYDPKLTFNKWVKYEIDTKKKLYEYLHSFGLVALMFNQGKLSTGQAQTDWYNYANQIARKSVGNQEYEPFQRYQMMDTFMRWRCVMETSTETAIKNHMVSRPFGGNYGTANLKILNAYTRYMTGLAWPDALLPNMLESDPTGQKMLEREALDAYRYTSAEWASQPYDGYNTFVYLSLAQLSPDIKLATLSHLGFQAAMAKTASVWMKGILATYSLRDYPPFKSETAGAYASHWFYLGGQIPAFTLSRSYLVGAAVNYALPVDILAIARNNAEPLDTRLMLLAGSSKVHAQSYMEKDFGVFSPRSATRDRSSSTGSTFVPGQTTPPGVVWSPKLGRANFWLTLTEDQNLMSHDKSFTNTTTNLVHAKRAQQWLQHKATLLMVTDNIEGQLAADKPTLHQIIGSMPDPNSASAIDTSCAQTACKQSTDGKPVYQLFYSRDNKVLIGLSSSRPFTMLAKRTSKDWQNAHGFVIPLEHNQSLSAGVAIEAADYAAASGANMAAKLENFKKAVTERSAFKFSPPLNNKQRSKLEYTDRFGVKLQKEYIWDGNTPYWRRLGWDSSKNPDPRPLEFVNGVAIDHTIWPAIDNRLVIQPTVNAEACPLYVRKTSGNGWLKIWDNTTPPFTPNTKCPVLAP